MENEKWNDLKDYLESLDKLDEQKFIEICDKYFDVIVLVGDMDKTYDNFKDLGFYRLGFSFGDFFYVFGNREGELW